MRIKTSYAVAALLALALAGWLWSGQLTKAVPHGETTMADEAAARQEAGPMAVQVRDLVAESIEREIVANGKTVPFRAVEVRAETNGRVVAIGPDEGERVAAGDLLVKLDPQDREVGVLEAEAQLRQRRIELDAARKLGEKGFQAETSVAKAEANHAAAAAALRRAELALEHTEIGAPFDGILNRRSVEIGDFLDIGEPVATVLDLDPLLVAAEVIETEVGKLATGMPGVVRLATGEMVRGRLHYIARRADERTRTFAIELEVPNPDSRLAAGVSAELRIAAERLLAHRVSPSVLTLGDDGVLGVKTVGDDDRVGFEAVEIAKADGDSVWLAGLPKQVRVITIGQDFVRAGSLVRPVPVTGDGVGPLLSEAAS